MIRFRVKTNMTIHVNWENNFTKLIIVIEETVQNIARENHFFQTASLVLMKLSLLNRKLKV